MGDIVLIESFDLYADATSADVGIAGKWVYDGTTTAGLALVAGAFGGQALQQGNNAGNRCSHYRVLPGNYASFSVGFYFKYDNLAAAGLTASSSQNMIAFMDGTGVHMSLNLHSNGTISLMRAGTTLIAASAAGVFVSDTWCHLEVVATIGDSARYEVFHNNTSIISGTGDTRNAGNAYINRIRICCPDGAGSSGVSYHDDIFVHNAATQIGVRRVGVIDPSADTADKDFTPLSGTDNFAMLDETTVDGDTTYVQGSTVGDLDLYDMSALPATPASVTAVQVVAFAKKTDVAARTMNLVLKSGSTQDDGTAVSLGTGYQHHARILNLDPATAAAWSASAINALQAGFKVAS